MKHHKIFFVFSFISFFEIYGMTNSYIDKLPDEILLNIVFKAMASSKNHKESKTRENIRLVCKRLKNIADEKAVEIKSQKIKFKLNLLGKKLVFAAKGQNWDQVRVLIPIANVDAKDEDGNHVLGWTINWVTPENDQMDLVRSLIEMGVNIHAPGQYGSTPLEHACTCAAVNIVKLLISLGADVNVRNKFGETPLHLAAYRYRGTPQNKEILEFLIKNGANIDGLTYDNETPLHHACMYDSFEGAKILIEHGANLHIMNSHENTILHRILIEDKDSCIELYKLILNNGFNTNIQNQRGDTILHELVHQFIDDRLRKDNKHRKDDERMKKYIQSRLKNLSRAIALLINYKADPKIKNNENISPMDNAIESNCPDLVRLLEGYLGEPILRNPEKLIPESQEIMNQAQYNLCNLL